MTLSTTSAAHPENSTSPHSSSHLVMIPSYNPGMKVVETVRTICEYWNPVWVVCDGSTDGSTEALLALEKTQKDNLRIIVLPENQGKGAALQVGLLQAQQQGFTHVLTIDADGQHPVDRIALFMQTSQNTPQSMVLGLPIFGVDAPLIRVRGRKISNAWANLETLWAGIGDSLYGFRVYPIAPLLKVMRQRWMRRFDFDPEAAVRLSWLGIPVINIPAPVRYYRADQGGVSHFNYWRDNVLLTWMHTRLFFGFLWRLPVLLSRLLCRRWVSCQRSTPKH